MVELSVHGLNPTPLRLFFNAFVQRLAENNFSPQIFAVIDFARFIATFDRTAILQKMLHSRDQIEFSVRGGLLVTTRI